MKINIAYSCNEYYVQHTGISMISLFENNKDVDEIIIYFIAKDVNEKSLIILREITENYGREFIVINFEDICYDLKLSNTGRHIETVYSKLFFSRINGVDKILYIDSDTIINNSIIDIWSYDISEYYFGCVKTITKSKSFELGIEIKDDFFNDGIALVNCRKLDKDNMIPKFLNSIDYFDGNPPVLSEGIINKVCHKKILSISPRFNYSPIFFMFNNKEINIIGRNKQYFNTHELDEARRNPAIIHFLSGWYNRPWVKSCTHPLKDKYLYHKFISPWKDVPLLEKELDDGAKRMRLIFKFLPVRLVFLIDTIRLKMRKYNV